MARRRALFFALLVLVPLVFGVGTGRAELGNLQPRAAAGDQVPFSLTEMQSGWGWELSVDGTPLLNGTADGATVSGEFKMPDLGYSSSRIVFVVATINGGAGQTWSQRIEYFVPSSGGGAPSGGGGGGVPTGTGTEGTAPGATTPTQPGQRARPGTTPTQPPQQNGTGTTPPTTVTVPGAAPKPSCWFEGKLAPCDKPPKGAAAATPKTPAKVKKAIIPKRSKKSWMTPLDGASRTPERPSKPKPPVTPEEETSKNALRFTLLIGLGTAVVLFILSGGLAMLWLGGGARDRPVNFQAPEPFPDTLPPAPVAAAVSPEPDKAETAVLEPSAEPLPDPERAPPLVVASDAADAPTEEEKTDSQDGAVPEEVAPASTPVEQPEPAVEEPAVDEPAVEETETPAVVEEQSPAVVEPSRQEPVVPVGINGLGSHDRPNVANDLDEIATDAELMVQELCQGTNDPASCRELAREELKAKLEQVIAEEKARVGV